jgi:DNA polymerase III delta prime subunit
MCTLLPVESDLCMWIYWRCFSRSGIDVVRNRIKMFAQKKVSLPPHAHKIIILDEADSMTAGAQQALRRTMELFSSTTRFALSCNNSSKIIEPIQSRCAILRYTRLSDVQLSNRLLQVIEAEQVHAIACALIRPLELVCICMHERQTASVRVSGGIRVHARNQAIHAAI